MDDKILHNIAELIDTRKFDEIVIESIKELQFHRGNAWQYTISFITGLILAYVVAFNFGTVSVMTDVSELLFNTSIVIIGVVLGAYSIFQALMQKELVLILTKSENNLLLTSNKSFKNLIILYVINAFISLTVWIILNAVGKEFCVFDSMKINDIFSTILILFYIGFNLLLLLELIVFTTNLYRIFCIYNTLSALDAAKNDEEL